MNGKHQIYEHVLRVPFVAAGPGITAGRSVPDVVAMVDIAPTLLQLAGVPLPVGAAEMDGRSFAPALLGAAHERRTTMMVEFYSLSGNKADVPPCAPGAPAGGDGCDGCDGEHAFPPRAPCFDLGASHSDVANNTFIGLRIVNDTHDLTYAEYVDVRDLYNFSHVVDHELFDLREDPYQLRNVWRAASPAVRAELHAALRMEFGCRGGGCRW